ncbi:MAG: stringent starvation protein A [Gammaproteobacteria bacterium]|nr:MAG: stringent starvation protein A [Gammaproteobacteria bacterium]
MATVAARRPVMTLFSRPDCPQSHRARLALAEKGVGAEVVDVADGPLPEDLLELNPYGSVPTLVDRELVLYHPRIIMEYLDERYPHPPLMPMDPVSRARTRLYVYRIERDWYGLLPDLEGEDGARREAARRELRDGLTVVAPIFERRPFFMSEELTLADCTLAPLLWRLGHYGVQLPPQAAPVLDYARRLFERPAFQASLSEAERRLAAA